MLHHNLALRSILSLRDRFGTRGPYPVSIFVGSLLLLLSPAFGTMAAAQEDPGRHGENATEIVLLGTVHFTAMELPGEGIVSETRQTQLDSVAELISEWGADRFFVECTPDEQPALDSAYRAYRSGKLALTEPEGIVERGEIYQLGFRAARAAGTPGVECMDAEVYLPSDRARRVAAEHNPELHERFREYREKDRAEEPALIDRTVREFFLHLNRDSALYNPYYIYYHARMGSFDGSGEKIQREGDLAGSTFAAPFELAERHMTQLREFVQSVDGRFTESVGPDTDYVILLDEEAAAAESGPGTGADTLTV